MFKKELTLPKNQKGQALLIVILVMVVALTVGLSVATRTITNLRNTNEEENSQKALSAAEAGIERAIKSGATISTSNFSGDTTYNTTYAQATSNSFLLNGGNIVPKNDATYVWLSPYSTNPANLWKTPWSGTLQVSFGTAGQLCSSSNKPPAVEVAVVSVGSPVAGQNNTNPTMQIKRYTFDPCARATGFISSGLLQSNTVSGINFNYQTPASGAPNAITVSNGLIARIDLIYSSSQLGITGIGLPAQGITITSIGSTGTSDKTTRKITVFQGYPEIPAEFFPYTLFQP